MSSGLEVSAHPTGPWLVKAGTVVYAVPAELGRSLVQWQGRWPSARERNSAPIPAGVAIEQWTDFLVVLNDAFEGHCGRENLRLPPPIWLRLPLMPAARVTWMARRLAFLAGKRGLLGLLIMGLAGYTHLGLTTTANPMLLSSGSVATAVVLFLVTAFWHELGHAAALARSGYRPGGIGVGMLFVVPVLFADVTAVGVLPRLGRMQVDVAGVVFQFALGALLAVVGAQFELGPAPMIAAWLALLAVGWSLFPFIRADGYWLVCDYLGVVDLEADPPTRSGRKLWVFLRVYRLMNAAFLLVVGFVLPWRYAHRVEELFAYFGWSITGSVVIGPMLLVAVSAVGFVWWNILRRVARLVRKPVC